MKYSAKIEFPCGMKYDVEVNTWGLAIGFGQVESKLSTTLCPLHGKECSRKR